MQISSEYLQTLLPKEHFEVTETTLEDGRRLLLIAQKHHIAAQAISAIDTDGSYQLVYDAARKALQAILSANGFRIAAAGGHYAYVKFAESGALQHQVWTEFRLMRLLRNSLEYPNNDVRTVSADELASAHEHVKIMLAEVEHLFQ